MKLVMKVVKSMAILISCTSEFHGLNPGTVKDLSPLRVCQHGKVCLKACLDVLIHK